MWVVKTRLALQGAEELSLNQIKYQGTIRKSTIYIIYYISIIYIIV